MKETKDKDPWEDFEKKIYNGSYILFAIYVLVTIVMVILRKTILPI